MTEDARRWQLWQASGLVTELELNRADVAARAQGCSLDEAFVKLGYAQYPQLTQALSETYALPGSPLLDAPPNDDALRRIPGDFAAHWGTTPVSYDESHNVLTLAVSDIAQVNRLRSVFSFLMQPQELAFTVASVGEIREAVKKHYGCDMEASAGPPKRMLKLNAMHSARRERPQAATEQATQATRALRVAAEHAARGKYGWVDEFATTNAELLVTAYLREDSEAMNRVRARVRYTRLIGSRLGFSRGELHSMALAAWLSGIDDRRRVIRQFSSPYDLEAVIFPATTDDLTRSQSLALSLVRCYENLVREDCTVAHDVTLARRHLQISCPASRERQDVLETFLQILMDEQFMEQLDHAAHHVLVVDSSEQVRASVSSLLNTHGCSVHVASSAADAFAQLALYTPTVLLVGHDLPDKGGMEFCRMVKGAKQTSGTPLLMLIPSLDAKLMAEALRSGADDFLAGPLDDELLLLKLDKLVEVDAQDDAVGVSGSLSDMGFTDMIQILCAGNKDMMITLEREGETGQVFVKQGTVVHAVSGEQTGERAFFGFMRWNEGEFTAARCSEFPEETIRSPTMSLLMEGARQVDEQVKDTQNISRVA
jgi:CheY-like chemotaxis protein